MGKVSSLDSWHEYLLELQSVTVISHYQQYHAAIRKTLSPLVFEMQLMGKIKGVAFHALIDDLKRILWCLILFYGQDNIDDGSFWKKKLSRTRGL